MKRLKPLIPVLLATAGLLCILLWRTGPRTSSNGFRTELPALSDSPDFLAEYADGDRVAAAYRTGENGLVPLDRDQFALLLQAAENEPAKPLAQDDPPAAFVQPLHVGFRSDTHPVQKQPPHTAPARPFRRQAAEGDFGRSAAVTREHLRIVRDQPDIPLPEPGSIGRPQCGFGQCAATARCIGRSERPARRSVGTPQDQLPFGTLLLRKRLRRGRAKFQKEAKIPTPPLPHDVVQPRNSSCRQFVRRQRRHPFARRKLCIVAADRHAVA